MSSLPFWIAIFALWSVLPAIVVFFVLFTRQLELKRAIDLLTFKQQAFPDLEKEIRELSDKGIKQKSMIESLEESFLALNGKWTQRLRQEDKKARKRQEEEEEPEPDQIPVEQQAIPFPGQYAMPVPGNGLPIKPRKFGEPPRKQIGG